MKYVRTEDAIFIGDKNKVGAWEVNAPYKVFDRDIISQADTIGELCDEFIGIPLYDVDGEIAGIPIHIKKGKHYFFNEEKIEKLKYSVSIKTSEFYGAIWTDKGLKYVAKMNKEGELELL